MHYYFIQHLLFNFPYKHCLLYIVTDVDVVCRVQTLFIFPSIILNYLGQINVISIILTTNHTNKTTQKAAVAIDQHPQQWVERSHTHALTKQHLKFLYMYMYMYMHQHSTYHSHHFYQPHNQKHSTYHFYHSPNVQEPPLSRSHLKESECMGPRTCVTAVWF